MTHQSSHSSDRKLGDEWSDWNEKSLDSCKGDTDAGKALYFGLSAITVGLFLVIAYFLNYLIEPRLAQLHPELPHIVTIIRAALSVGIIVLYLLVVLSVLCKCNFGIPIFGKRFFLVTLAPTILKLGHRFGVSRDRLSNSFIKVSNSFVRIAGRHKIKTKPLVLLPRCLQKKQRLHITSFAKKLGCDVFVVSGGEAARRAISQMQPTAVVGVACERDLVSGIRDTILTVPVLGIANKRPEGPCKNTVVDCEKVEDAIRFFFGSQRGGHF